MASLTVREDMERVLRSRGYDNYPDNGELFEELLDELAEVVHVHKGDW